MQSSKNLKKAIDSRSSLPPLLLPSPPPPPLNSLNLSAVFE
jgi:hypothetical protein